MRGTVPVRALWATLLLIPFLVGACQQSRPLEFVNISFTPSVDTDDYSTWDFDLASCRDFDDVRVDNEFLRRHLLEAIQETLESRGYERRAGEAVDFEVFYELGLLDGGDLASRGVQERTHGRIVVRDTATDRLVWAGERKVPVAGPSPPEVQILRIREFAADLLQYTRKLEDADEQIASENEDEGRVRQPSSS